MSVNVHSDNRLIRVINIMTEAIVEILNESQFQELKDLLEDDFVELIETFIVDSQKRITIIKQAFADADNTLGYETAHSLKGASANLGATQLTDLCYKLQHVCQQRKIKENNALIENVEVALNRVIDNIQARIANT